MNQQDYTEYSLALQHRLATSRIPLNGAIEVTRRCPLECAHCYNNLPMGDQEARSRELTYEEYCHLLDEIAEAGCLWLLFTGGEIFARKDFLDIYAYAKRKGFIITLFTNGTQITTKIADFLADLPPFSIEITLYGRTRETYEQLTGIPGSHARCLHGIRLLMERGLPLKLKTVGVTINKHEIWDMKRFAEEDLGLEFKFDSMINARIDCSQSPLSIRLRPEEIVELDLEDPRRADEWRGLYRNTSPVLPSVNETEQVYICGGGVNSFAVDPEGKMTICVLSHRDTYDLRTGSFREGWENFLYKVRAKKITRVTKCRACALRAMCSTCPATAELEHGDPEEPIDFFCQVTHLRAHALDLPVPPHGDCACCAGGPRYHQIVRSAAALKAGMNASSGTSPRGQSPFREGTVPLGETRRALPMVKAEATASSVGCSSGGCGSCNGAVRREA